MSACSAQVSAGRDTIPRADVEAQASRALHKVRPDLAPPQVDCTRGLALEVGATTRCFIDDTDGRLGVTVKVTEVDGSDYRVNVKADDALTPR